MDEYQKVRGSGIFIKPGMRPVYIDTMTGKVIDLGDAGEKPTIVGCSIAEKADKDTQ